MISFVESIIKPVYENQNQNEKQAHTEEVDDNL